MSEALKEMILPELRELKMVLADKDAEIAALKRMLAEVRGEKGRDEQNTCNIE